MPLQLMKFLPKSWEEAKGLLKLDFDHLQEFCNGLENRVISGGTGDQTLNPNLIQGTPTPVPKYVASTGTKNRPKWDQVDLSSTGVKNRLPFSHLVAATSGSILIGRASGPSGGDWQEISLGPGLSMSGTQLRASTTGIVLGWGVNDGSTSSLAAPYAVAPRAGVIANCKFIPAAVGPTNLSFDIRKNGSSVLGGPQTIHTTATPGVVLTFPSIASVLLDDVFSLAITSGSSAWRFTVQVEA